MPRAAACLPLLLVAMAARGAAAPVVLEAERADLVGVEAASVLPGFSGTGYVTGFNDDGDSVTFTFTAAGGLVDLRLRVALPHGTKGWEIAVNGEKASGLFILRGDGFSDQSAGLFLLRAGENTVTVEKGWGWFFLDAIALYPGRAHPPLRPPDRLADLGADAAAKGLFGRLLASYGTKTLAGQYGAREIAYTLSVTGREPAVAGFDFMDASPSRVARGSDAESVGREALAWARRGGVVTFSWHWNAPRDLVDLPGGKEWWSGFYTEATTFDLAAALANPESDGYRLLLSDMDAIAGRLKVFRDAGIPVLWRPLHEAQGAWFWWGAKGPKPFVRLWRLMFERYTRLHGLHNLVWVYTTGMDPGEWYPGDAYVDVVGADIYTDPSATMTGEWEALQSIYGVRKLIALTETGTVPDPAKTRPFEIWWSWFTVWSGRYIRSVPRTTLRSVYSDPSILTLDQLPR